MGREGQGGTVTAQAWEHLPGDRATVRRGQGDHDPGGGQREVGDSFTIKQFIPFAPCLSAKFHVLPPGHLPAMRRQHPRVPGS